MEQTMAGTGTKDEPPPKTPRIPRPPSKEELDEISKAQAMITDDWTGEGGDPKPNPKPEGSKD